MDTKNDGVDLGEMIGKIMSNPEFSTLVKNIKEESSHNKPSDPQAGAQTIYKSEDGVSIEDAPKVSTPDAAKVSSALGGLMSSDMISKIPDLMSALGPIMKQGEGLGISSKNETDNRNRLLLALKPYISKDRCEMIDTVLSVSKLTNLIDFLPNKNKS